jgi:hypothetical protein
MMEIISHRGFWNNKNEKNATSAFLHSFENGFGTETDIRDYNGELVISHDIPIKDSISLRSFFSLYNQSNSSGTLALNIKSDGLYLPLIKLLEEFQIANYFVFDMSVPDTISYLNKNVNVFTRQSEYENVPVFYNRIKGVWLDAFISTWYDVELIKKHLELNKMVAIVSSELHGRSELETWRFLKENELHQISNIILCTDYPTKAKQFFYE